MHSVNELLDGCRWRITVNVAGLSNHRRLCSPSTMVQSSIAQILFSKKKTICLLLRLRFSHSPPHLHLSLRNPTFLSNGDLTLSFSDKMCLLFPSLFLVLSVSISAALRDTESYSAESYCSYQGHTAPIITKELNCFSVKHKFDSERPRLALGWC